MERKVNILEVASIYAENEVEKQWRGRSENLYVEQDNGDLRYNAEAQEIFNESYDYHLTVLKEMYK